MKYELNVETKELVIRDQTEQEIAQEDLDRQNIANMVAEREAAEAAEQEAENAVKESAMAKLAALGLTDEEIAAIIG